MKSDQEFLAGVWNRIANLEAEELEKAAARRRNRRLGIRRAIILAGGLLFLLLLVLFVFLGGYRLLMNTFGGPGQYGLAGLLLAGAYVLETRTAKQKTEGTD